MSRVEPAPWTVIRWLPVSFQEADLDKLSLPSDSRLAYDMGRNPVVLFPNHGIGRIFSAHELPESALTQRAGRHQPGKLIDVRRTEVQWSVGRKILT